MKKQVLICCFLALTIFTVKAQTIPIAVVVTNIKCELANDQTSKDNSEDIYGLIEARVVYEGYGENNILQQFNCQEDCDKSAGKGGEIWRLTKANYLKNFETGVSKDAYSSGGRLKELLVSSTDEIMILGTLYDSDGKSREVLNSVTKEPYQKQYGNINYKRISVKKILAKKSLDVDLLFIKRRENGTETIIRVTISFMKTQ